MNIKDLYKISRSYKKKSLSIMIIFVILSGFHPNFTKTSPFLIELQPKSADFHSEEQNLSITFNKYKLRANEEYSYLSSYNCGGIWRAIVFYNITTDYNEYVQTYFNHDQANIFVQFNISDSRVLKKTTINIYLIAYESYIKNKILEQNAHGYHIIDLIEYYSGFIEDNGYFTNISLENSCEINASNARLGNYLLIVDFVIPPFIENEALYDNSVEYINGQYSYYIKGGLNYDWSVESIGFVKKEDYFSKPYDDIDAPDDCNDSRFNLKYIIPFVLIGVLSILLCKKRGLKPHNVW